MARRFPQEYKYVQAQVQEWRHRELKMFHEGSNKTWIVKLQTLADKTKNEVWKGHSFIFSPLPSYAPFNLHLLDHYVYMDTQSFKAFVGSPFFPLFLSPLSLSISISMYMEMSKYSSYSRTFSHPYPYPQASTPLHTSIWDLVQLNPKFYDYEESYRILTF